jgi:hypothetical protein
MKNLLTDIINIPKSVAFLNSFDPICDLRINLMLLLFFHFNAFQKEMNCLLSDWKTKRTQSIGLFLQTKMLSKTSPCFENTVCLRKRSNVLQRVADY